MPPKVSSLLAGRNKAPLSDEEVKRVVYAFMVLDPTVNVRHDVVAKTGFRVSQDESGNDFGEIVFGADVYPGGGVVDPNSALSLTAAAAHELTHYYRWRDKAELGDEPLENLDEALTSLEAICRYERHLNAIDVRQLASDAIVRIRLYLETLVSGVPAV